LRIGVRRLIDWRRQVDLVCSEHAARRSVALGRRALHGKKSDAKDADAAGTQLPEIQGSATAAARLRDSIVLSMSHGRLLLSPKIEPMQDWPGGLVDAVLRSPCADGDPV
jgi:hypothetical protein